MGKDKRIVVYIEDDPDMIHLVRMMVKRHGFTLVGVVGGRNGLATVRRLKPHLILLDLMMPDMDGWEVYRRIKADDELGCIPVIVITARAQSIDRTLALRIAKVDDYVTKPFLAEELLRSMRGVLDPET
ncbi:MAG: response regulator [Anaerolineae bacterium]|jgi:DNA-binding response OmpR family regulator